LRKKTWKLVNRSNQKLLITNYVTSNSRLLYPSPFHRHPSLAWTDSDESLECKNGFNNEIQRTIITSSKPSHKIATTDNSMVCCAPISILAGSGRATPRKIGWKCAPRFSKPLPYFWSKSLIFFNLFMTCLIISYLVQAMYLYLSLKHLRKQRSRL